MAFEWSFARQIEATITERVEISGSNIRLTGEHRAMIANLISQWGCKDFGRGPAKIRVHQDGSSFHITLQGFMTPMEQLITRSGKNAELVAELREKILEEQLPQWRQLFAHFGFRLASASGTVNVATDTRHLLFTVEA